ncbi:DUF5330 domain-containing protein [Aureimonas leprariae]|uniref:DUF5330 domain-containing protein n=1 Tax=Plantimonas leprariae TaxID=2615207 RepID=A0A7V7PPQ3_9HYPH|nr:DUF5330 domain-containing protein [Aureimonas leprariae]KAB0679967.1 hypothetical protein F6X38_10360 [Aureimonas leprariae]
MPEPQGIKDVVGMIRFVLKSALALGLVAMIVPLGAPSNGDGPGLDLFGVANGVREAAADLGGFCTRAPAACEAGREVVVFAGERIETGLRIGYGYLNEHLATPQPPSSEPVVAAEDTRPDPVTTGAVEPPAGPRPYTPPRPLAPQTVAETAVHTLARQTVAIPTPAPRG